MLDFLVGYNRICEHNKSSSPENATINNQQMFSKHFLFLPINLKADVDTHFYIPSSESSSYRKLFRIWKMLFRKLTIQPFCVYDLRDTTARFTVIVFMKISTPPMVARVQVSNLYLWIIFSRTTRIYDPFWSGCVMKVKGMWVLLLYSRTTIYFVLLDFIKIEILVYWFGYL